MFSKMFGRRLPEVKNEVAMKVEVKNEDELALSWLKKRASELTKNSQNFLFKNYYLPHEHETFKNHMQNLYDVCLVAERIVSKVAERDEICEQICGQLFLYSNQRDAIGAAFIHCQIYFPTVEKSLDWRNRDKTAAELLGKRREEIQTAPSSIDKYVCCTLLKMPSVNPVSLYNLSKLVGVAKNYHEVNLVPDASVAREWLTLLNQIYPEHSALDVALQIVYRHRQGKKIISRPADIQSWREALQQNGYQDNDPYKLLEFAEIFKEPGLISRWKQVAKENDLGDSIEAARELSTHFTCPEDVSGLRKILNQNGFSDTLENAKKLAIAFVDPCNRNPSESIQSEVSEWADWIRQNGGGFEDLRSITKIFNRTYDRSLARTKEWVRTWEKFAKQEFNLSSTLQELFEFIGLTREETIDALQVFKNPSSLTEELGIEIARKSKLMCLVKSLTDTQRDEWKKLSECTVSSCSTYRTPIYSLRENRVAEWFQAASLFNKFSHEDVIAFAQEEIKKGNQDPKSMIAVTIFFQDFPLKEGSYWNAERRQNATLTNIVDHAVGYNSPYMSIGGGETLGRLMGAFGVTKQELEKKDINVIADKIIRTNEAHNYAKLSLKK